MKIIVVSTTLRPSDHPDVTIIGDGVTERIAALESVAGRDIWLFGGGMLFRGLVDTGLVDTVEVAVMPVLLGGGIPLSRPAGAWQVCAWSAAGHYRAVSSCWHTSWRGEVSDCSARSGAYRGFRGGVKSVMILSDRPIKEVGR